MACGGFTCSKNALTALNILYILVSIILISVSAYSRTANIVTSVTIVGGIIACGVFLFLLAVIGLIGAIKHHQVLLFFYMVILFLLFLVQFAIACACLTVSKDQQQKLAKKGWMSASNQTLREVQYNFNCCGFNKQTTENSTSADSMKFPPCGLNSPTAKCCTGSNASCCVHGAKNEDPEAHCACDACFPKLQKSISRGLKVTGGIGLFFSFTEFVGVWLTVRYRNQKDPRANPGAFL